MLFAAGTATGAPRRHDHPSRPYLTPEFEVPATNGYRVDVFGIPASRRDPARVGIFAWNETSATSYLGPGKVEDGRIRASLGRFGKVDVHFQRGGKRWVRSLCGRDPLLFATGTYAGTVEFEGEGGFTQALAPELEAEPLYHAPGECVAVGEGYGGMPGVHLQVLSRYGTTVVVQNTPGGAVRYNAFAENRIGRIEISRTVEVIGPSTGFQWSPNLKRATVIPPAPFSGTATYQALGGRVTHWEGNLKVDFPGFPDYPLTRGPSLTKFTHGDCHIYLPPSADPHPPVGCY
ncbi:MAG TPA: hypothetical protein VFX35_05065 [Solirubrobacterales bacterium]|nr:hypothetical protein [Solirubrobacterales bacterium]